MTRIGLFLLTVFFAVDAFGQTVLNFPRTISSHQTFTGIAVSNPTPREVSITFTAYLPDGALLARPGIQNPITVTIPAGGQYARLSHEIFPSSEAFNGWIQAASSQSGLAGFFLNANTALTDIDGAAPGEPETDFVLPVANEDGTGKTEVTLVNINSEQAAVQLTLYAAGGSMLATRELTLSGRALIRQTMGLLFGEANIAAGSHLRVRSDRPVVGHEVVADFRIPEVSNRRETMALSGRRPSPSLTSLLPQFVTGDGWASYLSVVNGSGLFQEVTLTAYKEDGTRWNLPANPKRFSLPGNGALKTTVQQFFDFPQAGLSTGWIEVRSTLGYVVATVGYGNVQTPSFAAVSAVEASQASLLSIYSHTAEGGGLFTGITAVNPGSATANVEFFMLRPDGTTLGNARFTIGGNQRVGKLFRELLPASFDQPGWVFVRSDRPIIGAVLFGSTNGYALATVPSQRPAADFVPPAQTTATISGAVRQDLIGAAEVIVTLTGPVTATKTTDATGLFVFTQLPEGNYKLTVSKAGAQFFPSERSVTLAKTNVDRIDFSAVGIATADMPSIALLSPASIFGGTSTFNVTVFGSNFNQASFVRANDRPLQTSFISSTELRAAIPATVLQGPGTVRITVFTPPPGGGNSNPETLTVNVLPDNPLFESRIEVGPFPAGVAVHPKRKIALVTSQGDDTVRVIDLRNLQALAKIKVGRSPAEGIAIHPDRDIAVVANPGSNNVSIIDLRTNEVSQTIDVGRFPIGVAVNASLNQALVTVSGDNNVAVIDLQTFTVARRIPAGNGPAGVAINSRTNFAVVANRLSNDVSIIDLVNFANIGNVQVGLYPRGVAVNPNNNTAIVANANSNSVSIVNMAARSVLSTINVGPGPTGVAIHLPTNTAVVTNSGITRTDQAIGKVTSVSIIQLDTRQITEVPVGAAAFGLDIDSDAQRAVVANYGSNDIFLVRLPNPRPTITDVEPKTFPAGGGGFTVTVRGTGFLQASVVTLNGQTLPTIFVSSTELRAQVTAAILQQLLQTRSGIELADAPKAGSVHAQVIEATFNIAVSNPGPGGGESPPPEDSQNNRLVPQNAQPILVSVDPREIVAGASELRLTVSGNNFNATSRLNFDGVAHSPETVSATSLTAVIPGAELRPGSVPVSVTNPPPGGGATPALTFTVLDSANPAPSITSVSPAEIAAGAGATAIRIAGSGFMAATTVNLSGAAVQAALAGRSLEFTVPASMAESAGTIAGIVSNPAPGGGTASFSINVLNGTPSVAGFAPQAATAGAESLELTVLGSRFASNAVITIEGTPVSTQVIGPQELRGMLSELHLRIGGRLRIGVLNPPPGGASVEAGVLSVASPRPAINEIAPAKGPVSALPFAVRLAGSGFVSNSVVSARGMVLPSVFDSQASLTVTIPASIMTTAGTLPIVVTNPEPGGGASEAVTFTIEAGVPRLNSIDPPGIRVGEAATGVTLNGLNFAEGATVVAGDLELPAALVSPAQLRLSFAPPAPLGRMLLAVRSGNALSNAIEFSIASETPVIVEVRPATASAGQPITVIGSNFGRGSRVLIGGIPVSTTAIGDGELTAIVPLNTAPGPAAVSVVNPEPGGGISNEVTVQLAAAAVAISSLEPAVLGLDRSGLTVTVAGRGFTNRSVVQVDGIPITTIFVSETTLRFNVPALTRAGTLNVVVINPAPGGGTSAAAVLTIVNPLPVITDVSPDAAFAGTTVALTVTGTGFVDTSSIHFNDAKVQTAFVNSTTLTATLTIAAPGQAVITVSNPAPGGGVSNSLIFEAGVALNPRPTITFISPQFIRSGTTAAVQIHGSGFAGGATVLVDGTLAAAVAGVSSSLIQATLSGLAPGIHTIAIMNPAPGGGVSNSFSITAMTAPQITALSPPIAAPGSSPQPLVITGSNLGTDASVVSVMVGATLLQASSVLDSQVTVDLPPSILAAEATHTVVVSVHGVVSNGFMLPVRFSETFAAVSTPADLIFSPEKDLFVANSSSGSVIKISPGGYAATFASSFNKPTGMALSGAGDLYVADNLLGTVSRVSPAGTVNGFASGLSKPNDIAFDSAGNLFVANSGDGSIKKIAPSGAVTVFATISGAAPFGLAFDSSGTLFVSDSNTGFIHRFDSGGQRTTYAVLNKGIQALAFDAAGNLFAANGSLGTIDRIDRSDGRVARVATGLGSSSIWLATHTAGPLYAASGANGQVIRFAGHVSAIPAATPFVARMEPAFGTAGGVVNALVLGSGLSGASSIDFPAAPVAGTVQSGGTNTQVPVTVTVSDAAVLGPLTFTLATPFGPANSSSFDIVGTPAITSLNPASATAESDDFVLTIQGTNLHSDAVVNFGSAMLIPSSVTPSELKVVVPTSAVLNIGNANVTVRAAGLETGALPFRIRTPVTSVTISPAAPTLTAFGATHQFQATAKNAEGNVVAGKVFAWTSSGTAIASVDGAGLAVAVGNGEATITATVDGISGSTTLQVDQTVATVTVLPNTATLTAIDGTQPFSAEVRDGNGHIVTNKTVVWSSISPAVASVDSVTGIARALSQGTSSIKATAGDQSASANLTIAQAVATIEVTPATAMLESLNVTQSFTATAKDANGNSISGKAFGWSSGNPDVASIDAATGAVTSVADGTATPVVIRASVDGKEGTATLLVSQKATTVQVTADSTTFVSLNATQQLRAAVKDANNQALTGKSVVWSSDNPEVASVDNNGLVKAVSNGTALIKAAFDGRAGELAVSVDQAVHTIAVAPAGKTLASMQETQQFTVTLKDALDNPIAGKTVVWSSNKTDVATVTSGGGLATAVANGVAEIKATVGSKSATASLTVAQAVATVQISPETKTFVSLQETATFSATVKDAKGNVITGKTVIWTLDGEATASIDSAGVVKGLANGSTVIRAAVEGKTATAAVTVAQVVHTITIAPASRTFTSFKETQTFTVTVKDALGSSIDKLPNWSSSKTEVAGVVPSSNSAVITAVAEGETAISVTAGDKTATATVTVAQAVNKVTVMPASYTFAAIGETAEFKATPEDALGNLVAGKPISWTSSSPSTTVTSAGLVTAAIDGTASITATIGGKSGSGNAVVAQAVSSVSISPENRTMVSIGETFTYTLTVKDAKGNVITGAAATWTPSNPDCAVVSNAGVVEARANGSTTITVTAGGKSATAQVIVSQAVDSVSVVVDSGTALTSSESKRVIVKPNVFVYAMGASAPDTSGLKLTALGETIQLKAIVKDALGKAIAAKLVSWNSGSPERVDVDQDGKATARRNGPVRISATVENKTGFADLTVEQRVAAVEVEPSMKTFVSFGESHPFKAIPKDSRGNPVEGKTVSWNSASTAATVDGSGVTTAGNAEAETTITASADGQSKAITVRIAQEVASIVVAPDARTLFSHGDIQDFTVIARDSRGNNIAGKPVEWISSNPALASINTATGRAVAHANGRVTIGAKVGGKLGTATLIVAQGSARIELSKGSHEFIALKRIEKVQAKFYDVTGNEAARTITWSSDNEAVAAVNPAGDITAQGNGTAIITASADGVSASAGIRVAQALHGVVIVETGSGKLKALGIKRKFAAKAVDPDGWEIVGKTASWRSSNDAIASLDSTGEATAKLNGTVTITATVDGKSATATLQVDQEVDRLISLGGEGKLKALNRARQYGPVDSNGNAISGKTIAWSTSSDSVASVDATGVAKAKGNGIATIQATVDGKTVGTDLEVSQDVAIVDITSEQTGRVKALKKSRNYSARAKDPDGFEIAGKTVTWTSSDSTTATIGPDGIAVAEKNGKVTIKASIDGVDSLPVELEIQQVTDSIEIAGDTSKIVALNRKRKFTAKAKDENGIEIAGKTATWSSTNPDVPVDAMGEITAKGNGASSLRATIDGISQTISVAVDQVVDRLEATESGKVKALNRTRQFKAVDADGNAIVGKTITWSTSQDAIASVDPNSGVAKAKGNGLAKIQAIVDGNTVETDLEVSQQVSNIEITPGGTGRLGALKMTRKFTARATDPDGFAIAGKTVNWTSSDALTATIGPDGTAVAEKNGKVTVKATIDGIDSLPVDLEIQQVTASVEIVGDSSSIPALNRKRKFTAKAKDENGLEIPGKTAIWSSTDDGVAPVDAAGEITAQKNGSATLRATVDGVAGTLALSVDQVIDRIAATETGTLKALNRTRQYRALDAGGNEILGKTIEWSSSATGVVAVTAGLATAKGNGSAGISAKVNGKTVSATLEVLQEVATVSVNSAETRQINALNKKRKFQVEARDPDGFLITDVRPTVWTTSGTTVVSIDTAGEVTSKKNGNATVTATFDGIASPAHPLEVSQEIATVEAVDPALGTSPFKSFGEKRKFVAKDANGVDIQKPIAWASSDLNVIKVDETGEVTSTSKNASATVTATVEGKTIPHVLTVHQEVHAIEFKSLDLKLNFRPGRHSERAIEINVKDALGNLISEAHAPLALISDDTSTVTVATEPGKGRVIKGLKVGTTIIRANAGGKEAFATVVIG